MISENTSLKPFNTFGIDASARYFARFDTLDMLQELLESTQFVNTTGRLVLGGGSNLLLTGNYNGIVVKNELMGMELVD
ncbi:MAG: UDP-N-acetylenolpyruvoylglucosamine reductase, partial [Flavobacteriales bacterium]